MRARVTVPGRIMVLLVAALLTCGCGGGGEAPSSNSETSTGGESAAPAAEVVVDVPDACTFLDRARMEEIIGWELREGEPKDAPQGASACDFETPPLMYVTRTFPDPALPSSAGFGSLAVNTHAVDPARFAEFRQLLGTGAEDVSGIGDGAYFYGPDMIYVRVGDRGFSLRLYANPESQDDRARAREVMLALARLGASNL